MARASTGKRRAGPVSTRQACLVLQVDPATLGEEELRRAWRASAYSAMGLSFEKVMAVPLLEKGLRYFAIAVRPR